MEWKQQVSQNFLKHAGVCFRQLQDSDLFHRIVVMHFDTWFFRPIMLIAQFY